MSLYASRRCLTIAGRAAGSSSSLSRTWSSSLVVHHRCYTAPAAAQKTKTKPAVHASAPPSTSRKAGKALSGPDAARKEVAEEKEIDEQLETLELMQYMMDTNELDLNSVPIELLDLHIPAWRSTKDGATFMDHMRVIGQTQSNWFLNVRSMYRLARDRSIPGVGVKSPWSYQLFRASSTSPSAWLAPFRQAALETYKRINEAVAARDDKPLKNLAAGEQLLAYNKLIRSQDPRFINVWKFHGEREPCRVVSIRAVESYYGSKGPRIGSRLAVQALVRFDTMQSVETYSKKTGARVGETEPKRVIEYLVFQKRMWTNAPWVVRDRLYEGLQARFTVPSQ